VCNDRWEECWTVIEREQRRAVRVKHQRQRAKRQAARAPAAPPPMTVPPAPVSPLAPTLPATPDARRVHPWRRLWSARRQHELASAA